MEKNKNIKKLYLYLCFNIKDFTPLYKLENLEFLDIGLTNNSDISFKKNINVNRLNLICYKNINENNKIFNR